jgi:hypothetical protein
MRGRSIALAVSGLMLVGASSVLAEEVGCCETECHTADGAGRDMYSVQRRDMTQSDCERSTPDCRSTWQPEQCNGVGGSAGGVVREPEEGDNK